MAGRCDAFQQVYDIFKIVKPNSYQWEANYYML